MEQRRLLIANRGEIALRVMRSARELGYEVVAIYGADDQAGLHVRRADTAAEVEGHGASAYLNAQAIVECAQAHAVTAVHPGYGFLSEQAGFAALVESAGIQFVGPTVSQLELFGDKLAARELADRCAVPIIEASGELETAAAFESFRLALGDNGALIIKAAGGGGGRGMRIVAGTDDIETAVAQARAEAQAAFGDDRIFAERFIERARHVEVQILGDGNGDVVHLGERDCTLQRRHQKLIEFAPAPSLKEPLRRRLHEAAVAIASEVGYRGVGTIEFLVEPATDAFYFIEANARLQVEHTVTEEVTGVDLVRSQLLITAGASLDDLGLAKAPPIRGQAVQLRVNAESFKPNGTVVAAAGTINHYTAPSGPGARVDGAAYVGYRPHPGFDSLLAKLVVSTSDPDLDSLLARARAVASEYEIGGCETSLPLLQALLASDALTAFDIHTRYIEQHAEALAGAAASFEKDHGQAAVVELPTVARHTVPAGMVAVKAPMRGSIISIDVSVGDTVRRGETVALMEAMKMHHDVIAEVSGVVTDLAAQPFDVVDDAEPILVVAPDAGLEDVAAGAQKIDLEAERDDLNEVRERHAIGLDAQRPQAVQKRRKVGSRTARENVEAICDDGSFIEYGALAIAAQRRRRSVEDLRESTPADGMVAGFGTVNAEQFGEDAARCAVFAYDYTVLAGTQGHHNHKKKDRLFELAAEWETPIVFFTEGGGGRPGDVDTDDLFMSWLDIRTFATWPQLSGKAPRIAVNSGRCYAGNAVIFGCADITIATKNSNIGLAGPAMIEGGGLGKYRPEDIGPIDVQTQNGVVDLACEDEVEAARLTRQILGFFQGQQAQWDCCDQRRLRHLIPEDRLRVYDIRAVVESLADSGSVIELRRDYGVGLITALVRVEGKPFGLIANDPRHLGGAIDGAGGEKGGRFLQLCDTFGLPVISLCDTPGYMVGPDSEKTAAVRRGSRLIIAGANLTVPLFTIVIRKGYGLGAQAMAGGSFHQPFATLAWPTAEMGPMGLEGAVELGFRKELEATADDASRRALFEQLVGRMYDKGKAVSVASTFEIDAVIDPAETRSWLLRAARAAGGQDRRRQGYIDVW